MEQKTNINAEDGKQELVITREFDLPLELLFMTNATKRSILRWIHATFKAIGPIHAVQPTAARCAVSGG